MKNKDIVLFYTEYSDECGKTHYAVHKYHSTSGIVDMMRDFKPAAHNSACHSTENYESKVNV